MLRVLDSMSFHKFIEERGPPFRTCDIFDDVYALINEQLKRENSSTTNNNSTSIIEHIKELANQLLLNVKQEQQKEKKIVVKIEKYFLLGKFIATTNLYTKSTSTIASQFYER